MIGNVETNMKGNLKKAVSLVLMTTVCTVSVFSVGNLSKKVNVEVDGENLSTLTLHEDTDKILSQVGVETKPNDVVTREDKDNEININVKKSFNVYIIHDGEKVSVEMAEGTVEDALNKAEVNLGCDECMNVDLKDDIFPDMDIVISPMVMVTINMAGEANQYFAPKCSVIDALRWLGIDISSEDILNVDALAEIYDGMEINLNKVEYTEETVEEEVPFNTIYKKSDIIKDNEQKIVSAGKNGVNRITYRKIIVDGQEVSKEIIDSVVVSEPVDEIIITNNNYQEPKPEVKEPAQLSAPQDNNGSSEGAVLTGSATAYTASSGSRTSTGAVPCQGVTVAVNPHKIPYGTRLKIKSLDGSFTWNGVAQDTGGALMKGSALVDIYMNSRSDCIRFGRKQVEVTLLN